MTKAETTTFIQDLARKRGFMTSAVSLLETSDPTRLDQFLAAAHLQEKDAVKDDKQRVLSRTTIQLTRNPKFDFVNKILWNMQTLQVSDITNGQNIDLGNDTPANKLDKMLREPVAAAKSSWGSTLLVIKWVTKKAEQENLGAWSDLASWLFEWSQNDAIKTNFSTIAVFTTSFDYFPAELVRWCNKFQIPTSTEEERAGFLQDLADNLAEKAKAVGIKDVDSTITPELIKNTRGLNFLDLSSAMYESFAKYRSFRQEVFSDYKIKVILSSYKIRYIEPKLTFDNVRGFEYLKTYFRERIIKPTIHAEKYLAEGIEPPKGMVLFGPPRVGKTYLCNALAAETTMPLIQVSASDLMQGIVGGTESRVRQIVDVFESFAPCYVFLDEADQILARRESLNDATDSGVTSRMISGLLEYMGNEDRKAFIIAATNFLGKIDKAFLSTGRLDKSVIMLYPDFSSRLDMLKYHCKNNKSIKLAEEEFEELAADTAMWSSAEIKALPTEAAYVRFQSTGSTTTFRDFEQAMKQAFRIDVNVRKTQMQEMIQTYTTYAPNYEPYLLEMAKASLSSQDKDLQAALMETLK